MQNMSEQNNSDFSSISQAEGTPITADHENCIEEQTWEQYKQAIDAGWLTASEAEMQFGQWRKNRLEQLGDQILKAS